MTDLILGRPCGKVAVLPSPASGIDQTTACIGPEVSGRCRGHYISETFAIIKDSSLA